MDWLMKMCMTGQAIYDNFHQGRGPDGLAAAAAEVEALIKNYENRKDSISRLTERMESAWQGDAGGAARRGAGPLAVEHGLAAPEMNTAQTLVDSQVQAFGSAKGSVMPIPPEPKEPGFWDNVFSFGGANDTYEKQKTTYNAANDHNVTVMSNYEGVTDTNTSGMPKSYGSLAPDQSGVGVVEQKTPPPPPPPRRQPPEVSNTGDPGDRSSTNPSGTPPRTGDPGTQLGPTGVGPNSPTGQPPQQTDPGRYPGIPNVPRGPGGPGTGPGGPGTGTDVPGIGPGFVPAATGFGPHGGGGGSGGGTGAGGGRGPGGGSGAGTRGGFGPGGGPGAPGEEGARPGARGAAAALGAGAGPEGAGARGTAAGAGGRGGGMGGMPVGAGGRGQGGEDSEHQRPSFLVEADPDDTFGTDEVTAPPVIGE